MPRLSSIATMLVVLAACEPPPPVGGGDPKIEIIAPVTGDEIAVSSTGRAYFPVAVYISNFEFAPGAQGSSAVEGQGHYHLFIGDTYLGNPSALLSFIDIERELTVSGDGVKDPNGIITVNLVGNGHQEFVPNITHQVEVKFVVAQDDGADDTGDTGG